MTTTEFSRANPSPRYQQLQALYRTMHEEGERFLRIPPEQTFPGVSLFAQVPRIKRLIERTGARIVLDYGSGKGVQYQPRPIRLEANGPVWPGIQQCWGVEQIVCYDPCYARHSALPVGRFDGVISTDVLEHCPEEDVPWIIGEIFSYAKLFVFANVACYPAKKRLPNGENAHCTIKPVVWWRDLIVRAAALHPEVQWEVWIQSIAQTPRGPAMIEERIGSAEPHAASVAR